MERIAALPARVIDGKHKGVIASRLARADTLIYLGLPRRVTMPRVLRRIVGRYGRVRADAAPGRPERVDLAFPRYAWNWNRPQRAKTHAVVAAFRGRTVVLGSRREQTRFDREQFAGAG